jgi:mono/diheme cytochrome c family protein/uncharacterized protein YjiS (DUF1127 family)
MTETANSSFSSAAMRCCRLAADVGCLFHRALHAHETRRALRALPDNLLRDVGLNRAEIDFVADSLASGRGDPTRDPHDHLNRSVSYLRAARRYAARLVPQAAFRILMVFLIGASALAASFDAGHAQDAQIKRGRYLVTLGGCNDCHTPGYLFGKPDMARFLGGSDVGFEIPGLGTFYGPNLTPDGETGLGNWSTNEIATAITTGKRPDGRILAPVMPWHAFASLTGPDIYAIAVFLKSLPAVSHKVPGPFGPNETPTSFVMKVVPPKVAATDGATLK